MLDNIPTLSSFYLHLLIKTLSTVEIEGSYLNIIKATYEKPKANIILREILKVFPLRIGIKQGCQLSPLLFNMVLGVLVRVIRQEVP